MASSDAAGGTRSFIGMLMVARCPRERLQALDRSPERSRLRTTVCRAAAENPGMTPVPSRLVFLAGKPAPKGSLAALVKTVKAADIGKLAKLSASTADTSAKLHAAIAQLYQAVAISMQKSGLTEMFKGIKGGDDMTGMEMLTVGLLMGRFSQAQLGAMKTALQSKKAVGKLQTVYDWIGDSDNPKASLKQSERMVVEQTGL